MERRSRISSVDYACSERRLGSSRLDSIWQAAYRLGLPVARRWWRLTGPRHESAVVAVYVRLELLLVRQSYRDGRHLPGGGVRRGETAEAAAPRRNSLTPEAGNWGAGRGDVQSRSSTTEMRKRRL